MIDPDTLDKVEAAIGQAIVIAAIGMWVPSDVVDYATDVPLFEHAVLAAEHGLTDIESPTDDAVVAAAKIAERRGLA